MSKRDQILNAALGLFTDKGFSQTSVASIRAAAEVSNGSFFHAFESKEELGAALYLRALEQYHQAVKNALAGIHTADGGIEAMVIAHIDWVVSEKQQALFLFGQSQSNWLTLIREQQQLANLQLQHVISTWAAPLVKDQQLMPLSPLIMGAQLVGPTQIVCRAWLSGRDDSDPREHQDELIAVTQRALLARAQ